MKFTFVPEYRFNKFSDVNVEFLVSNGVKGIILDIDNTLEPYENSEPSIEVLSWFEQLKKHNIKTAFVSNNNRERVEVFNKNIGSPAFYKAGKPFKKKIISAMNKMSTDTSNTIMMGDQVFTDVWGAHNAGIKAVLVPPINDKKDVLTRFKRLLEKTVLKRYNKIHGINK